MSYNLNINDQEKYIRFEVRDELTEEDIVNALKEIEIMHREQRIDHILCDQRQLKVPPKNMVIFETAERIASEPFRGMKLAIVREVIPKEHFFKTVANNRSGIVNVFDDEKKAEDWLNNR